MKTSILYLDNQVQINLIPENKMDREVNSLLESSIPKWVYEHKEWNWKINMKVFYWQFADCQWWYARQFDNKNGIMLKFEKNE